MKGATGKPKNKKSAQTKTRKGQGMRLKQMTASLNAKMLATGNLSIATRL